MRKRPPGSGTGLFALTLAVLLAGCSTSHPNRTHRGDLLDDKVTIQRVEAALRQSGGAFDEVRVSAKNGVVGLTGAVSTPAAKARAEEVVRKSHRVKEVNNQVQVRPKAAAQQ